MCVTESCPSVVGRIIQYTFSLSSSRARLCFVSRQGIIIRRSLALCSFTLYWLCQVSFVFSGTSSLCLSPNWSLDCLAGLCSYLELPQIMTWHSFWIFDVQDHAARFVLVLLFYLCVCGDASLDPYLLAFSLVMLERLCCMGSSDLAHWPHLFQSP